MKVRVGRIPSQHLAWVIPYGKPLYTTSFSNSTLKEQAHSNGLTSRASSHGGPLAMESGRPVWRVLPAGLEQLT